MKRKTHCLFFILTCLATLPACAGLMYSAEPIDAKAIDADTKQPLAGVIVIAHWELRGPATAGGSAPIGQLRVLETVTDKDGQFSFPAWGPKPARGALLNRDPQLLLFKPGYRYRGLENEFRDGMELEPLRRSEWNRKTIALKPFKGSLDEYTESFKDFNRELDFIINRRPEDCEWKKIPRAIATMIRERKVLEDKGARYAFSIDQQLLISDEYFSKKGGSECGSPKNFIKSLER